MLYPFYQTKAVSKTTLGRLLRPIVRTCSQLQGESPGGWRFKLASHGGGDYISEQTVMEGADNMPGVIN